MKTLKEMLREKLPDDAREHMIEFFKVHGVKEYAYFYQNLFSLLDGELRTRVRETTLGKDEIPIACLGKEIAETRCKFEIITEFMDDLKDEQGHAIYDWENWRPIDLTSNYFKNLQERIDEQEIDWKIELTNCTGNRWVWENSRREYFNQDVARIVNSEGTQLIFDVPTWLEENTAEDWIHVMMFSILPEKQKGFFHFKKQFASAASLVAFVDGVRGLNSPCLRHTSGQPTVRDKKIPEKKNTDWRTEEIKDNDGDEDEWKLLRLWRRIGFLRPKLPDTNPDYIYLFNPRHVLDVKKEYEDSGQKNPFRFLSRSVYGNELEQKLKE